MQFDAENAIDWPQGADDPFAYLDNWPVVMRPGVQLGAIQCRTAVTCDNAEGDSEATLSLDGQHNDAACDESDDDGDDSKDEDYDGVCAPKTTARATKAKTPRAKAKTTTGKKRATGRARLTDEQKAQNKRRREEDRTMLDEMRAFLKASEKKQKTAQRAVDRINNEATVLRLQDDQSNLITFLGTTVSTQQVMIANLNMEVFNMGAKYRVELADAGMRHRDELADADVRHRDEVAALQESVETLRQQLGELEARDAQRQLSEIRRETAVVHPEPRVTPPAQAIKVERRHPATRVKQEPIVADPALYTWQAVDDESARCVDLYGFTAAQIAVIYGVIGGVQAPRVGKGRKSRYNTQQLLLMTLYHFVHYPTIKTLRDRFNVSQTKVFGALSTMINETLPPLIDHAMRGVAQPVALFLHDAYFWPMQRPENSVIAARLFDAEKQCHGLWIHCAHDAASGKALAYAITNNREPDAQWLAQYTPNQPGGDVTRAYEARMQGKFAMVVSRYRGAVEECDRTARILLALVNLDIGFANAVRARESIALDADEAVL